MPPDAEDAMDPNDELEGQLDMEMAAEELLQWLGDGERAPLTVQEATARVLVEVFDLDDEEAYLIQGPDNRLLNRFRDACGLAGAKVREGQGRADGRRELVVLGYRDNIEAFRALLRLFMDSWSGEIPVNHTPCCEVSCHVHAPRCHEPVGVTLPFGRKSRLTDKMVDGLQKRTGAQIFLMGDCTRISGPRESTDLAATLAVWATHFAGPSCGLCLERLPCIKWSSHSPIPPSIGTYAPCKGLDKRLKPALDPYAELEGSPAGVRMPATSYFAEAAPPEDKHVLRACHGSKEYLGSRLYAAIENQYKLELLLGPDLSARVKEDEGSIVAKVTGMLLELDMKEVQVLLKSKDRFDTRLFEAVRALRRLYNKPGAFRPLPLPPAGC